MAEFKLTSSDTVFETEMFEVTRDRAEHPSGAVLERAIVHNQPAAVMLPRDEEKRVLLVRQYRLPLRDQLLELPAGRCDNDETPLEAARRELKEETGFQALRWTPLNDFFTSPGFSTAHMYAFLAEGLKAGDASPEPYEIIEQQWLPWTEALEAVRDGTIRDAKTVATLLYCEAFRI